MNFEDGMGDFEDFKDHMKDMEKEMFKIDVSRGGAMALDYDDFVDVFGEPNDEDLFDLTQAYIQLYMKQGDDECIPYLVDSYSEQWVRAFLNYNERIEEYELCSILKEHLDIYSNQLHTSY